MNRFAPSLLALLPMCLFFAGALSAFHPKNASLPNFSPSPMATDTLPPVISCPPSITLTLGPGSCDTSYLYSVTATDNEPGVIVAKVSGIASGAPFPVGATTNLFLAVDLAANTASCSFSVTVQASPVSGFQCNDLVTLTLDQNCMRVLQAGDLLESGMGCPEGFTLEVDRTPPFGNGPWQPAIFGPTDLGKTYQARATDMVSGNKCWGNVKLVDSLPPVLQCPTIEISCAVPAAHLAPVFLKDSLGITAGMPLVAENCPGTPNLSFTDQSFNLPCDTPGNVTGYILRTWTALDNSGNPGSCQQRINRMRTPDLVVYPADITVSCATPNFPLEIAGAPGVPAGNRVYSLLTTPFCELDAFFDDSTEMLCAGSRRVHRTWTIQDVCRPLGPGNPLSGVQRIDVLDQTGPVFICPADTVLVIPTDSCRAPLDLPDLIVRDACAQVTDISVFWTEGGLTQSLTGSLGDFSGNTPADSDTLAVLGLVPDFPVGVTVLLYVATDDCGNEGSCEVALQLWDSVPPAAVCDTFLTVLLDREGQALLPAGAAVADTADACGPLFFKIKRNADSPCLADSLLFSDQAIFCCAESGDTLALTLRVYDVPPPAGGVGPAFGAGQFQDCLLRVLVSDTLGPVCTAPADVSLECAAFGADWASYGMPSISCRADSLVENLDFSSFDSSCARGTVLRKFQVFESGTGSTGACVQRLEFGGMQNYFVRFPDDVIVTVCDSSGLYGAPQFFSDGCENMSVTYTDEIFTVVPDACFKIERLWRVVNTCTFDSAKALVQVPNPNPNAVTNHPSNLQGPVVSASNATGQWAPSVVAILPGQTPANFSAFWSADANGYMYKQIIKVIDTQKPALTNCPSGQQLVSDNTDNDPQLWNASYWFNSAAGSHDLCESPADLCLTATDQCSGSDINFRYLLFLDLDNDGVQETVVSSTNLPGYNNVQFGNAANPNYTGGSSRAFDTRPVPANQKFGFALQTTAQGNAKTACVRWNTQQKPLEYAQPQLPHGTHRIRWIVSDKCGNETTCETVFSLSGGPGACSQVELAVSGQIRSEAGMGIADVSVQAKVNPVGTSPYVLYTQTDAQGQYSFDLGNQSSYQLIPARDDDPLNGVSTLDLVLINKHVLGLTPLTSPIKIIAADANNSRSVSTFDIIELRKLILGIYTELPASPSWRFVDGSFVFPDPGNPFATVFPESVLANPPYPADPAHNFTGLKVGDVNGNAVVSAAPAGGETRQAAAWALNFSEIQLMPGEVFSVPVAFERPVAGFQLGLEYPGLELLDLVPGEGLRAEHFAVFPDRNWITASWPEGGTAGFELKFQAKTPGRLSEHLRLTRQALRAEVYFESSDGSYVIRPLELRFDGKKSAGQAFELFQNEPNPFSGNTRIGFYLPEASALTLRVLDGLGRQCFVHSGYYPEGRHRLILNNEVTAGWSGLYYYTLETAGGARCTGKMLVLEP